MSFYNLNLITVHRFPSIVIALFCVPLILMSIHLYAIAYKYYTTMFSTILCMPSRRYIATSSRIVYYLVIVKPNRLEEFVRHSYIVCDQWRRFTSMEHHSQDAARMRTRSTCVRSLWSHLWFVVYCLDYYSSKSHRTLSEYRIVWVVLVAATWKINTFQIIMFIYCISIRWNWNKETKESNNRTT